MTAESWFYTRHGERQGPVPMAKLREFAACGDLDPRLDLVWAKGMDDWRTAGDVDGLFERRQAPVVADAVESTPRSGPRKRHEGSVAAASPYVAPASDAVPEALAASAAWPGARRRMFLIMTVLFPVVWQLGFGIGAGFLASSLGPEIMAVLLLGASLVPLVVTIYYQLARLQNLGMSRWWFLGLFVPILNFWIAYRTLACPAGYAYHKQLDPLGWVLAILFWLSIVLMIAAFVVASGLMLGMLEHPELQDRLREWIQAMPAS